MITGDMNAKIRRDSQYYERVMGKYAIGERNDSGERLYAT